jgi:hypothetical protein
MATLLVASLEETLRCDSLRRCGMENLGMLSGTELQFRADLWLSPLSVRLPNPYLE